MIKNSLLEIKREHCKRKVYSEDIKGDYERETRENVIKDQVIDSIEKMEEFVKKNVPMNDRESKLWGLLLKGETSGSIMRKMGYCNLHVMHVKAYTLKKKIKLYVEKYKNKMM